MGSSRNQLRDYRWGTVTIAAGAAVSEAIDARRFAGISVKVKTAWTTAQLGLQASGEGGDDYAPCADRAGAFGTDIAITTVQADHWQPVAPYAFPSGFIKLWSHDSSGDDVNQAAERTIEYMLKS